MTTKELLALVPFVHHFRSYLLGQYFLLQTDHSSLIWLQNFKEPEGWLARWIEKLQEFNFTVITVQPEESVSYHGCYYFIKYRFML